MATKFFNPNYEISGSYNPYDLERAERAEMLRVEFDPEKDCPYDREFCRQKLVRIQNWCRAVEYHAANRIDQVFITKEDMFYGCPVPDLNCIRRAKYDILLKSFKEHNK